MKKETDIAGILFGQVLWRSAGKKTGHRPVRSRVPVTEKWFMIRPPGHRSCDWPPPYPSLVIP